MGPRSKVEISGVVVNSSSTKHVIKEMSDRSGNKIAWKRPISRIYPYNLDVGENYYIPMTTYLDNKDALETPGALTFSERIAQNWIKGRTGYATRTVCATSSTTIV